MIKCSKRLEIYMYCAVLTMVAPNTNSDRPVINNYRLLTKMKAEWPQTTPKKPCSVKKFYPTEAQRRLLNVCSYNFFLNPTYFDTIIEVNQFVTEHLKYITEFEKIDGGMRCPGMQFMSRIH